MLSGDPVVVKEESDDDHQPPAVNVADARRKHGGSRRAMSTIWRPNLGRLYASVAEMEGSESEDEENDATKKGVKRKRAPPTNGTCARGEVAVEMQGGCVLGRRRYRCKECKK